MEIRLQHILLVFFAAVLNGAIAEDNAPVIDPGIDPKDFKVAKIDDEFFEVGGHAGLMSIVDYGPAPVYGGKLTFHATEDLFIQAAGGMSEAPRNSVENFNDLDYFISGKDRELIYYDFLVGWNWLPGETFITRKLAFKSANYIVGGVGNTIFAGDNNVTYVAGVGYKLILTDFMTFQYDIRDHIFYSELGGDPRLMHNLELTGGLNLFF